MEVSVERPVDDKARRAAARHAARWQQRLLPFMRGMLVAVALFFFVASYTQLYLLNQRIFDTAPIDTREATAVLSSTGTPFTAQEALAAARLRAVVALEASGIERQYHQAGILLMSRLWTSYLGFLTGMVLALVGAAFVLGKIEERPSQMDSQLGTFLKIAFSSASPGLFLTTLGTILMVAAIVTHHQIEVNHRAVYLSDTPSETAATVGNPPPVHIPASAQ